MNYKNSSDKIKAWHAEMLELIKFRGHVFISGELTNHQREKCYFVYCPRLAEPDHTMHVSFKNYKRSRNGCLFCGRDVVSSKLTNRTFSEETIEKMTIAANSRPFRGGKPRRWRKNQAYRNWNLLAREQWKNECAISGYKQDENTPTDEKKLVVHHLIGVSKEDCLALVAENAILIHRDLHMTFYNIYGYRENTVEQFIEFLEKLKNNEVNVSISSQSDSVSSVSEGEREESQGSETRGFDYDKIVRLQERLKEVNVILKSILLEFQTSAKDDNNEIQ
jgi:hypothetical protein